MPRKPRLVIPKGTYHIILRGNERKNIFKDNYDKYKFLKVLRIKQEECNFSLYSYCLMDNHVHLIMKESKESISDSMKKINISYAIYFNKKYDRVGHVFQDRFKSELIENEQYLLSAIRYVHNNPVKANIVKTAGDYKWSSFHRYIIYSSYAKFVEISTDFVLSIFSENLETARNEFIKFSSLENHDKFLDMADNYPVSNIEIKGTIEADKYIRNLIDGMCITKPQLLDNKNKEVRNQLIKTLKIKSNLSIREIAGLLGVSRGVVDRVKVL